MQLAAIGECSPQENPASAFAASNSTLSAPQRNQYDANVGFRRQDASLAYRLAGRSSYCRPICYVCSTAANVTSKRGSALSPSGLASV
ncbi:hypothetical protein CGRA01v4_11955 [Colletotrichum graminicola]|nr:hypothetical protein CGRA01v4_11955 [Colletotrichum graminicola]